MATSYTPDALRGLMIPDPRILPGTPSTLSSYTQADPAPGVPVPTTSSALTFETSGTQTAGTTIDVQVIRAGGAVTTDTIRAGSFAWRDNGGAWQGWDGPQAFAGWEPLHAWAAGAGATWYSVPYVMFTSKGTQLVSTQAIGSAGLSVLQSLVVHRRTSAGATSTTTVVTNSTTGQPLHTSMFELPDGSVVLLVSYDDLASTGLQVRVYMSTDDGASWALQSTAALEAYIDTTAYTVKRLRAAYQGGQVLLMLAVRVGGAVVPDTLWQYASSDNGMSFARVEAVDTTDANSVHTGGAHDVYAIPGVGFGVVYCGSSRAQWGANSAVLSKRLGSAWSQWSDTDPAAVPISSPASSLSVGNQLAADTELAASVDDDGQIYALANNGSTQLQAARSSTGSTWTALGSASVPMSSACFYWNGERTESLAVAWYAGTLYVVSTVDSTTTYDAQLGVTALSGYTAATLPMLPAVQAGGDYSSGSLRTWVPYGLPTVTGWTATTIGAPTATLTGGTMQIVAGLAEVLTYTNARATPITTSHQVFSTWEVSCTSNTNTETLLSSSDGTNTYRLRVRVTSTTVVVIDDVSGATITTQARPATPGFCQVRAFLTNSGASAKGTVWWNETAGPWQTSREYVRIVSNQGMTNAGVTAAAQSVRIGQYGQGTSDWRFVAWQANGSLSNSHNLTIPSQLAGRNISAYPLTLSQGLRLRAVGGPAALDDAWKIAARWAHGVDALTSPSPRVTWRSKDTSTAQIFIWETNTTVANVSPLMGPMGALYIGGANFRTATLEGRNGAGAWVAIGTWDGSYGQSALRWNRASTVVTPATTAGAAGSYWYPHATLNAERFAFDTAAGPVRTIQYQTEGAWTHQPTKHARVTVYGDVSAVGANGTAGAVLSSRGLLVWNNDPSYSAYRLTIPVQPVAEAYYEAGVIRLGHLAVFGRRYSWGRNLTAEANVSLQTGAGGTRTSYINGPTRRAVEFGWSDGVDSSEFGEDTSAAQPDYVLGSSTGSPEAVAAYRDGPYLMRGIVDHLNGSASPVVYVAHLPRVALNTTQMVVHRDLMLYGRVMSDVSIETVQGREWGGKFEGEVVRTSNVRLEEEL